MGECTLHPDPNMVCFGLFCHFSPFFCFKWAFNLINEIAFFLWVLNPSLGAGHPCVPGAEILPPRATKPSSVHPSLHMYEILMFINGVIWPRPDPVLCEGAMWPGSGLFYPICFTFKDGKRWRLAGDRSAHRACAWTWLSPLPTAQCLTMNLLEAVIKNKIKMIKNHIISLFLQARGEKRRDALGKSSSCLSLS